MPDATSLHHCLQNHYQRQTALQRRGCKVCAISIYAASVVLFQLHGCVVSHMQVIATPLLSVHNIKYSFC